MPNNNHKHIFFPEPENAVVAEALEVLENLDPQQRNVFLEVLFKLWLEQQQIILEQINGD